MKRFIIAIGLMLILIAAGLASLLHAGYSHRILTDQIEFIQNEALFDHDLRIRETEKLVSLWTERREWLIHHVHHGFIDEIGSSLSRATVYAECDEALHLRAELAELYWLFTAIYEEEAVTLDNIF